MESNKLNTKKEIIQYVKDKGVDFTFSKYNTIFRQKILEINTSAKEIVYSPKNITIQFKKVYHDMRYSKEDIQVDIYNAGDIFSEYTWEFDKNKEIMGTVPITSSCLYEIISEFYSDYKIEEEKKSN